MTVLIRYHAKPGMAEKANTPEFACVAIARHATLPP